MRERLGERVLQRLLGPVEVAEPAGEHAEHGGGVLTPRRFDGLRHCGVDSEFDRGLDLALTHAAQSAVFDSYHANASVLRGLLFVAGSDDYAEGRAREREITSRWIWLVPSTICSTFASRM